MFLSHRSSSRPISRDIVFWYSKCHSFRSQLKTPMDRPSSCSCFDICQWLTHFFPFPSTVTWVICSEVGDSVKKRGGNDWISRNWNETLTAETKENNGRLSLSLLSDRLEVFVHSLPRDFSVPCLRHWRCATTRNPGIKLDIRIFLHPDVHLEATSSAYCSSCNY